MDFNSERSGKQCPQCNQENYPSAKYCRFCGAVLVESTRQPAIFQDKLLPSPSLDDKAESSPRGAGSISRLAPLKWAVAVLFAVLLLGAGVGGAYLLYMKKAPGLHIVLGIESTNQSEATSEQMQRLIDVGMLEFKTEDGKTVLSHNPWCEARQVSRMRENRTSGLMWRLLETGQMTRLRGTLARKGRNGLASQGLNY